jgi:hypothetical protein
MKKNFLLRNSAPLKTILIFIASGLILNTIIFLNTQGTKAEGAEDRSVVINEFKFNPTAGSEWIELYNKSGDPISLDGWEVKTRGGALSFLKNGEMTNKLVGSIPANGYYYIPIDEDWLKNDWDMIRLKNDIDLPIDAISYTLNNEKVAVLDVNSNNVQLIKDKDMFDGDSLGRKNNGNGQWCVFAKPSPNSQNRAGNCRDTRTPVTQTPKPTVTIIPTVTSTPVPTIQPTVEVTVTPVATVQPTTQPTAAPTQVVVPTQITSTIAPTTIQKPSPTKTVTSNNTAYQPFANGVTYPVITSTPTPTQVPTPTVDPSKSTTIVMNEETVEFDAKAGNFIEITNNFKTCDMFESLVFRATKDFKGKITIAGIDKSKFKNEPFENKDLAFGICELKSEGFEAKDIDSIKIKAKYSKKWLEDNKFTTDQLRLFIGEENAEKLSKKVELTKVEDKKINDVDYEILMTTLEKLPYAFAVAPEGVSSIVKQNATSFPWWIVIIGAGILAFAVTLLLLPRKNGDEEAPVEDESFETFSIF